MNHPLVGLKIVEDSPAEGEVARSLIASTFERFDIVNPSNAWAMGWPRGTWVIQTDALNVVTSVFRT